VNDVAAKGRMPKGTAAIYFMQLFSTLSFSVLYSTLVLYATHALHLSDDVATSIIGTFVAFNYALHLLGGYAGGRYLSYRSLFCTGMVLITAGCILIGMGSTNLLYWGLALFLTGSGVNVTCINCMLTQLFEPEDTRREKAFLWNYSGMNIGFFIGFAIAGYYQLHHAYHTLFFLSSIGNVLAIVIVLCNWKSLHDINTHLTHCENPNKHALKAFLMMLVLICGLRWLFEHAGFSGEVIMWGGIIMGIILLVLANRQPTEGARKKMWAYLILAVSSLIFWALYQLIPMGLTLFISRNVSRTIDGTLIPPQWFENINAIIIIIGGPLLAMAFAKLRKKGYNVNVPFQFSCSLLLIGVAMLMLPLGIHFAGPNGYISMGWPIICYVLLTFGELFISPIGYAMVGQLAPPKLRGIMMGTWLMLTGIGATLSSMASRQMLGNTKSVLPSVTNPAYSHTFNELGWIAIVTAVVVFCLSPLLRRLIDAAAYTTTNS
jgi:proton-dependent oligopeptide transporter, POT family